MTEHFDWIDMMEHMQEIRLFAGHHIRGKREGATSPQEVDMLSRIYLAEEPLKPLQLSELMGLSKSAVSRLIDNLERNGFLAREYSQQDKRSYRLHLTEQGNQELQQAYRHYLEPIYRLRRTLGEERFHTLLSQIREANHLLQNTAADK